MQAESILEMRGISKFYSGVQVLKSVNLKLMHGEILGLVGENGAGKSTLMKILSGGTQPDTGEILIDGQTVQVNSPIIAQDLKIAMVQQELSLIPTLSVMDNIVLGRERTRSGLRILDTLANQEYARKALALMDLTFSLEERVKNLSVANQQLIEIARCLILSPRVLILDEPTTALTLVEAESLLKRMLELKENGTSIIFISHKLEEITRVSDRLHIMRDGRKVGDCLATKVTRPELITMMVGDKRFFCHRPTLKRDLDARPEVLSVNHLFCKNQFSDVSFTVHEGEIFGFFGLKGAGRSELMMSIFGSNRVDSGEIYLAGKKLERNSPQHAIQNGMGFVTEDRKHTGIFPNMDIKNNILISDLKKIASPIGTINEQQMGVISCNLVKALGIKISTPNQRVKRLSGGNQQKVMISRWLHTNCKLLVLDEPTKGVDIGAKQDIYQQVQQLADAKKGIVVISSELEEVMLLCDRIAVMREGKILTILEGDAIKADKIMHHAAG